MKYIITITDNNGKTTQTTTTATDARQAHDHAATIAADGATIRVYPATDTAAGIARGAIMVARRTAVNAVMRTGGNETQNKIERETAAINARIRGAETAERILSVVREYGHDTQEFVAIAAAALSTAAARGDNIINQYGAAYRELNAAIHAQRAATEYELSTEFIKDGGGDIVSINHAVAAIIRGGDNWTPTDGGTMDAATAARLGAAIADAMRTLSETQKRIVELLARGYSQRQIAEKTGKQLAAINRNIAIIRGKVSGYISGAAAEFAPLIHAAATAAAATAAKNGGRTAAGAAKHKAAHNAEYYREYRRRKAAARKAAETNK